MIPLEQIKVASPCHADWEEMTGDAQVRFCQGCRKNVYNLSEMTADEAQALVTQMEGRLCVRFYTRRDGTMLTQDCPVGLRAMRVKLAKKLSYAAALLFSLGSGVLRSPGAANAVTTVHGAPPVPAVVKTPVKSHKPCPRPIMGKVAMPRPKPVTPAMMGSMAVPSPPPVRQPKMGEAIMGDMAAPLPPPQPK